MQRYGDFQGFATILLTFERVCCDKWGKMRQIEQIRSKFVRSRVRASKRSGDRFENLVTEEWAISAKDIYDDPVSGYLKIGFNGNDVYLQGLCAEWHQRGHA